MDPERFLDHPPNPAVLRALRADTAMAPPAGAEDAVWSRVTAGLAAGGAVVAAASAVGTATPGLAGGATASVAKATPLGVIALSKLFGMSFGVGLIVSGAGALIVRSAESRARHVTTVNVAAPHERAVTRDGERRHAAQDASVGHGEREVAASDGMAHGAAPDTAADHDVAAAASARAHVDGAGALAVHGAASAAPLASSAPITSAAPQAAGPSEESRIVLAARDALRAGEPRRALAELERADLAGLPGLAQERLALEIDAWLAAGMLDIAKERAAVFLQRYPDSPHAARFRSLR